MRPRISKNLSQSKPIREREGMSASHLANVRKLPCCVCGAENRQINAHHLLQPGDPKERGIARKAADKYAIPLCVVILKRWGCHERLHDAGDEETFLMQHGIDGRALASALWAARGDQEAMERVVFRFRQEAALKKGRVT